LASFLARLRDSVTSNNPAEHLLSVLSILGDYLSSVPSLHYLTDKGTNQSFGYLPGRIPFPLVPRPRTGAERVLVMESS